MYACHRASLDLNSVYDVCLGITNNEQADTAAKTALTNNNILAVDIQIYTSTRIKKNSKRYTTRTTSSQPHTLS